MKVLDLIDKYKPYLDGDVGVAIYVNDTAIIIDEVATDLYHNNHKYENGTIEELEVEMFKVVEDCKGLGKIETELLIWVNDEKWKAITKG